MTDAPKVYLVRAGRNGEDEDYALMHNLAIIGFQNVPSLEGTKGYDEVANLVSEALPDRKPRAVGNFAGQLGAFALAMREGDIVVLPRKLTSQIAIGRVTGPYRYQHVNTESRHTRPVQWLQPDLPRTTFEQDLLYSFGAFMTVCNISRHDAARRVVAVLEGKPDPGPSVPLKSPTVPPPPTDESESIPDLSQVAHDQIVAQIQSTVRWACAGATRGCRAAGRWLGDKDLPAWARRRCGHSRREVVHWGWTCHAFVCRSSRRTPPPT